MEAGQPLVSFSRTISFWRWMTCGLVSLWGLVNGEWAAHGLASAEEDRNVGMGCVRAVKPSLPCSPPLAPLICTSSHAPSRSPPLWPLPAPPSSHGVSCAREAATSPHLLPGSWSGVGGTHAGEARLPLTRMYSPSPLCALSLFPDLSFLTSPICYCCVRTDGYQGLLPSSYVSPL